MTDNSDLKKQLDLYQQTVDRRKATEQARPAREQEALESFLCEREEVLRPKFEAVKEQVERAGHQAEIKESGDASSTRASITLSLLRAEQAAGSEPTRNSSWFTVEHVKGESTMERSRVTEPNSRSSEREAHSTHARSRFDMSLGFFLEAVFRAR
jgi:hypothetical protein